MDDLDKASDQELLDALEVRRRRLTSAYLGLYLLSPIIAALAWWKIGALPAAGLGFGALTGGILTVFLVARRLTRSRLDLLAFERGLRVRLSPEAVEHLAVERLKGVDGPRCVLHLQGVALRNGGMVSVVLRVDDKAAEIETRAAAPHSAGVKLRRSSLPLAQIQGLREKVESGFGSLKSANRFAVRDGFPCELTIGRRDPVRVRRFECDLADPDTSIPIVLMARDLCSLAVPLVDMAWFTAPRGDRSEPLQS